MCLCVCCYLLGFVLFFETRPHLAQAGLELSI